MESENKENNPKIRYYKSQRYGWVEIHEGDRDWQFGISYDDFMNELVIQAEIYLKLSRCKQTSYELNANK